MHRTGTTATRTTATIDAREEIAEGLDDYRQQARDAHAALTAAARPPFDAQALAVAHLEYQRAELRLARAIGNA